MELDLGRIQGLSAYESAVENGFIGTEEEWLQSLKGQDGRNGIDGQNGQDGKNGKSAYEIALQNGFEGTEQEWIQSLNGNAEEINKEIVGARGEFDTLEEKIRDSDKKLEESYIIDNIYFEKGYFEETNTDYFITHIPQKDLKGNINKLKTGFAKDNIGEANNFETAREFSKRHNATVCFNAGIFDNRPIGNNLLYEGNEITNTTKTNTFYTLGIKEDNSLICYLPTATVEEILSDGCYNTVCGYFPLILNGTLIDETIQERIGNSWSEQTYPRQIIAQIEDTKEILFFTCNGKDFNNQKGMTILQVCTILLEKGVTFAYMLDEGGSTSTIFKNQMLNQKLDNNYLNERKINNFLYVAKAVKIDRDKDINDLYSNIGNIFEFEKDKELDLKEISESLVGINTRLDKMPYLFESMERFSSNTNLKINDFALIANKEGSSLSLYKIISESNLLRMQFGTIEINGVTAVVDENGVRLNGTATDNTWIFLNPALASSGVDGTQELLFENKQGNYVFGSIIEGNYQTGGNANVCYKINNVDMYINLGSSVKKNILSTDKFNKCHIRLFKGDSFENAIIKPFIKLEKCNNIDEKYYEIDDRNVISTWNNYNAELIAKSNKGEKGDKGEQGEKGEKGDKGEPRKRCYI